MDMAPTRLKFHNQSQKSSETFKEYAQRWHEMAFRVRPVLSDNELIDIFMGTLHGLYFEEMIGISSSNFTDIMTIGGRIENGVKFGKITGTISHPTVSRNHKVAFQRRRNVRQVL